MCDDLDSFIAIAVLTSLSTLLLRKFVNKYSS
ncbi:peptide transporter, partial [Francisella tularensis subsp. holarctica]|nr:peptide transporter [Francisella tularensis subsp. holarctica]